ncbi:hypothetical protein PFLL34_00335 [Pseudomonas fluorescens]|nr:hypothetical protein PFLL34_00335 [Pseudomonas fluorescens]
MANPLLIQACATAEHLVALGLGNAGAVVFHRQPIALGRLADAQAYLGVRPFTGVVQQIAQQFQQVFTVPGQLQARRHLIAEVQVFAVDHAQGGQ